MVMNGGVDTESEVTLRLAIDADAVRLRTLAQLDSAKAPSGPVLIAELDGRLLAALPLDGGAPIADPFRRSADVVALLRMRAAQMSGQPGRRRGPLATSLSALERRTAHLRPPKPLAPL
jgi:hypothetical protein